MFQQQGNIVPAAAPCLSMDWSLVVHLPDDWLIPKRRDRHRSAFRIIYLRKFRNMARTSTAASTMDSSTSILDAFLGDWRNGCFW